MMTPNKMEEFKVLFREYCGQEIYKCHCSDNDCEFCPVDKAYEKIFYCSDEEDEDEDED